jgi:hypothetical protein
VKSRRRVARKPTVGKRITNLFVVDSRVTPSAILPSHAYDQVGDDLHDSWSASGATFGRPLLGNERPSPDGFTSDCKSAALVVGQSESFATELLLENTVLFAELVNGRVLSEPRPGASRIVGNQGETE